MYVRGCYINVWLVNKIDKNVKKIKLLVIIIIKYKSN